MHTIKFRGKSLSTGEWVYGSLVENMERLHHVDPIENHCYIFNSYNRYDIAITSIGIDEYLVEVDPKTVGQYIGVKDHKEKEIFGGDIVKWDDGSAGRYWRVAQVVYIPGFWRFEIIPGKSINCFKDGQTGTFDGGSFMYLPNTSAHNNVMEIIGNVHSNHDLLTQ